MPAVPDTHMLAYPGLHGVDDENLYYKLRRMKSTQFPLEIEMNVASVYDSQFALCCAISCHCVCVFALLIYMVISFPPTFDL